MHNSPEHSRSSRKVGEKGGELCRSEGQNVVAVAGLAFLMCGNLNDALALRALKLVPFPLEYEPHSISYDDKHKLGF